MKTASVIISIAFLFILPYSLNAQNKYEREYRIKPEIIPPPAKAFIDSIGSDSKIKWYKEIGISNITLEAKFKHNKKKFSVEFDTLGGLQDVEFVVHKEEITPDTYRIIENKLDSLYLKWKFQKIQIQYRERRENIISVINENMPADSNKIVYEIVLKGKSLRNTQLYEITFNNHGEIQNILMVIQDKADHLEY